MERIKKLQKYAQSLESRQVPLMRRACAKDTTFDQCLKRWLFVQQQKQLEKHGRQKETSQIWNFMQIEADSKAQKADEPQLKNYITTEKYKRISPEFLEILNEHEHMVIDERFTKAVKFPTPEKPPADPNKLENINPSLASYLYRVMEEGNIFNDIYNINFYETDGWDLITSRRKDKSENLLNFMHLADVAYMLGLLLKGYKLTPAHMKFLMNFVRGLAQLMPKQLEEYLKLLQEYGVLQLKTIELLKSLLQNLGGTLTADQIYMIMRALLNIERYLLKTSKQEVPRRTFEYDFETISKPVNLAELPDSEKLRKDAFRYGNQNFQNINRSNLFLGNPSRFFLRSGRGEKRDGFVEPWDVEVPWIELQSHRRPSKNFARIHWDDFEYRRGMEKYMAERHRAALPEKQAPSLPESLNASQTTLTTQKSFSRRHFRRHRKERLPSFMFGK